VAAAAPATSRMALAIQSQRRRVRIPNSIPPISASTHKASAAADRQPARTSAQFCVWSPAKIMSPRLGWPTVVDSVAAPIVQTAAVRMPAITTGAASGASTRRSFCVRVMPTASAACTIAGSIPCSPATALRRIGSSA
jgi:hypothetical protein